jgi:hypothetical protein
VEGTNLSGSRADLLVAFTSADRTFATSIVACASRWTDSCSESTENALHSQLFIPSHVLSPALLTFFSTQLKFDKSTPFGPYLIFPDS